MLSHKSCNPDSYRNRKDKKILVHLPARLGGFVAKDLESCQSFTRNVLKKGFDHPFLRPPGRKKRLSLTA